MAGRYRVDFSSAARRQLANLPGDVQRRIRPAIDRLELDPRPHGVLRIATPGSLPMWRIRVGDYRVVYTIRDDHLLILVIRVGHRGTVYRLR